MSVCQNNTQIWTRNEPGMEPKVLNNWYVLQLDVDMSPPANITTFRLTLTHVSFDLDSCDPSHPNSATLGAMINEI